MYLLCNKSKSITFNDTSFTDPSSIVSAFADFLSSVFNSNSAGVSLDGADFCIDNAIDIPSFTEEEVFNYI